MWLSETIRYKYPQVITTTTLHYSNLLTLLRDRIPRDLEAVHQGGDQDPAPGLAALVRGLLPVHGEGGGAPSQGQAGVPRAEH